VVVVMTSSSDRPTPRTGSSYARFIPREELEGFSAWKPGSFGDDPSLKPKAAAAVPDAEALRRQAEELALAQARRAEEARQLAEAARVQALQEAREGGYHDGYRDGLEALENFKRSFATQTSAQVGALLQQFQQQLDGVEQHLAHRVTGIVLEVARQVLRSELLLRPESVLAVTQEALGSLLTSARHVVLRVHPDDHALIADGCAELLAARGARLQRDAQIERGGCLVESDIATVDARVGTRWHRAMVALGQSGETAGWEPPTDAPPAVALRRDPASPAQEVGA
jgi:flagellar assembly protein FliH